LLPSVLTLGYACASQGRSEGGISVFIPPKSAQVNFLWGKNDVKTAIQQFYTPSSPPQKKKLIPQNNFLATPLVLVDLVIQISSE